MAWHGKGNLNEAKALRIMADMANESEYQSLDDALVGVTAFEQEFLAKKDRRAVFATAYLAFTRVLGEWLEQGRFEDRQWMTSYGVAFANLYRDAVLAYPSTDAARLPKFWRLAFDTSTREQGLILHDLVLGMNATSTAIYPSPWPRCRLTPTEKAAFGITRSSTGPLNVPSIRFKNASRASTRQVWDCWIRCSVHSMSA